MSWKSEAGNKYTNAPDVYLIKSLGDSQVSPGANNDCEALWCFVVSLHDFGSDGPGSNPSMVILHIIVHQLSAS